MSNADRIEKQIVLRAPRGKVWRALTDTQQFGAWFGCKLEGAFVPGQWTRGVITSPGFEGAPMEMLVEVLEPERSFAFRWPHPEDVNAPTPDDPRTLVEFTLEDAGGGTRVRVVESGFEALPGHRRAEAIRLNDGGWAHQLENIERFVAEPGAS